MMRSAASKPKTRVLIWSINSWTCGRYDFEQNGHSVLRPKGKTRRKDLAITKWLERSYDLRLAEEIVAMVQRMIKQGADGHL